MRVVALLDGTVLDGESPLLAADDLGVLRGDGVFETVLVVGGRPRMLEAHLARLADSARMLDLPVPDEAEWRRCVAAACGAWNGDSELVLKLVITRGRHEHGPPTCFTLGMPLPESVPRQRRDGCCRASRRCDSR